MIRKPLLSALFLTSFLAVPLLSSAADMPPPPPGGPMMPHPHGMPGWHGPKMMAKAPVPMLMPIVWRHAVELQLTPSQEKQLQSWREEQKTQWQSQRTQTENHNRALREALLRGETGSALKPLQEAVVQDHAAMLQRGIAQVEFLHKLLTAEQWQKVTGIYAKMSHWQPGKEGWHKP
jgi:Spy/CpxP family protein refolding chaperone